MKKSNSRTYGYLGLLFCLLGTYGLGILGMGVLYKAILTSIGVIFLIISFIKYKNAKKRETFAESQTANQKSFTPELKAENEQHQVNDTSHKAEPIQLDIEETEQTLQNVFISYRREDSANVTGRIYDKLLQSFEKNQIFKDVDSIPLGVDFRKHLNQKVGECNVLIAVIGNQWIEPNVPKEQKRINSEKDFVRIEIESALERNIPVIPVLVRSAQMPQEDELPDSMKALAFRNGIPVRPDPDFHRDMERLIQGIKQHI